MANYICTSSEITSLADAIRTKGGTSASLTWPNGFISAVNDIPSGGGGGGGDFAGLIQRTITSASDSTVSYIGVYAFYTCRSLTTISFPQCTSIGMYAFQNCRDLTTALFPICTTIGDYAFQLCSSLTTISFPQCTSIGMYAFQSCRDLTTALFPVCVTISEKAFQTCSSLTTVSFPQCATIGNTAFRSCRRLLSFYILTSSVPTLTNINVFSSTPISNYTTSTGGVYGSIFVKASMLSTFQTAANWSTYSDRMVGLTDEQIAALSL